MWLSAIHILGKGNSTTDYQWRLKNRNPEWNSFSKIFKKSGTHLTSILHLVLNKRFQNKSHVDTKIQRLLIPSLLSEQFQSFAKFPPFSSLDRMGRGDIQNQDFFLVGELAFVPSDGSTSKRFLLILFPPNTLPVSDSANHPLYSKLNLITVGLSGKSSQR